MHSLTEDSAQDLPRAIDQLHFSMPNIQSAKPPSDLKQGSSPVDTSNDLLPKVLVIYFPQYHREPLNDKNWGDNFTDWNSLKASPPKNRKGFPIPRPTELGYYDLTDYDIRRRQRELALEHGIDGFIYHHYWFYDRSHPGPNLAAPLLKMLDDGEPNLPFLLNWCAVKWVNVWMGKAIFQTIPTSRNRAITLQDQFFDATDDMIREHYEWLSKFFHHKNYIKIDNKPAFLLYFYDERAVPILKRLKHYARQDGFDGLHLIVGRSALNENIFVPKNHSERIERVMKKRNQPIDMFPMDFFDQSMTYPYPLEYLTNTFSLPHWCNNTGQERSKPKKLREEIIGVITSFDNTPRRDYDNANIYSPDVPEKILERFKTNLRVALQYHSCCHQRTNDRFVAINAWNEWAEGMSVEPSDVYGRGFLEIIRDVKTQVQEAGCLHVK